MSETNLAHANLEFKQQSHTSLQPAEELRWSPEVQAEIERIGKANTYFPLDRDTELFNWLDDQRDTKLCVSVTCATGSGLLKSCQVYRTQYIKRRGTLLEIPATVIYAEIDQHVGSTDLYCSIMEEIGHPLTHVGTLQDFLSWAWGTLKSYSVKVLIVGNADYLSLKAFNELIGVFSKLRIPIILVGTYYLGDNILQLNSLPVCARSWLIFRVIRVS